VTDSSWLFNVGADIYAWFTAQAAWRSSCSRLADLVQSGAPERVLDLGCGPGVSTFALRARMPAAHLVGLDVAPRMLREARRRDESCGASHITWLLADAAHLPFASQSVDACTGHSFLYLVANRTAVLAEIRRVLRPGGRLILMEPNTRRATLHQIVGISRDPRHLLSVSLWRPFSRLHGRFSPDSLSTTLSEAGFERCTVEETLAGLGLLAIGHVAA
jgi:ubiquinone/menaquinone biosynthesis C-methylase UbiE